MVGGQTIYRCKWQLSVDNNSDTGYKIFKYTVNKMNQRK